MTVGKKTAARAIVLRDLALKALKQRGAWEYAGAVKLFTPRWGAHDCLSDAMRFSEPSQRTKYYLALLGGPMPLAFGLDVWHGRKKMLNLEWDVNGRAVVAAFKPGDWEAALEHLLAS